MAAVHAAMLSHLRAGDRVVASPALFGSCHWIVSTLLPRYGITSEFVDGTDLDAWRAALSRPAAMVLLESPSNPMLEVSTCAPCATWRTRPARWWWWTTCSPLPLLQKPLELGADVVVYSCTKHIDGQGRVLGGAVLGRKAWVEDTLQPFVRNTGPSLSPFNAWVLLKGLETLLAARGRRLPLGRGRGGQPGRAPGGRRVLYPSRADHPQHALAMSQMTAGGTLVTFELAGGKPAAFAAMNAMELVAVSPTTLGDSQVARDASRDHHAHADRGRGTGAARHRRRRSPPVGRAGGCGRLQT